MKQQTSLIRALLTSTLFGIFPTLNAFQNLGPAQNGSNSGVFSPATGYNFVASNITFTILNNTFVGSTPVGGFSVSLDNNFPNPGAPFINDVIQFVGNATLTGDVGFTNPIPLILLNIGNIVNNQISLEGSSYTATSTHIVGIGGTNIFINTPLPVILTSNFTTNNNNLDTMRFQGGLGTMVNSVIGSPLHFFNTIFVVTDVQFNNDVFANNYILTGGASRIEFASNVSPHGPITTTAGNNTGRVSFLGNADINFPIGTVGAALNRVDLLGTGTRVNLNADIVSNVIIVSESTTLAVLDSPTITGDLSVEDSATVSLANRAILNVDGTVNFLDNSNLTVDMGGNLFTTGEIIATQAANFVGNASVTILNPGFSPGQTTLIPILDGTVGGLILGDGITNSNTFLTTFSLVKDNVNDTLFIAITSRPLTDFANPNNQGVAGALDIIALGPPIPGGLDLIIAQLASFTSVAELNAALATLTPMVDGAILYESFNTQNKIFGTVGDRLDRMNFWRKHLPPVRGGVNAGDKADADYGMWFEVFKIHANQKQRQEVAGYKDDTWGLIIGSDRMITNNSILGFSLSWAALDINNHVSDSKTNVDAYQVTLYTDIDFNCPLYFKGELGIAYNHYKTARNIFFGDVAFFPRGRFHGIQTGVKGEMGYIFGSCTWQAIPLVSIFYSNLDLRSYQETGAGSVGLLVNREYFNTLLVGIGGKLIDDYEMDRYFLLQTEAHAMAFYDFFNDRMELTSQFTGSGPSFKTQGFTPARDSYDLGVGITLFTHYSFNLTGVYDFNFKQNYKAHSGFFRLRYEF